MSKQCFKCGETKPLDAFYKHPQMKDGLLGKCKECTKVDAREARSKRIDYYREYDRDRGSLPHRRERVKRYAESAGGRQSAAASNRRYNEENPGKKAARWALSNAVRDGKVAKPDKCEKCGSDKNIHGHHDDYGKPLDVRWLCAPCHAAVHKAMREPHPETGRLYNYHERR